MLWALDEVADFKTEPIPPIIVLSIECTSPCFLFNQRMSTIVLPDLSSRPFRLEVSRLMKQPPTTLYRAWTEHLDHWFARPGSVLMTPWSNTPFFFETEHQMEGDEAPTRHPHYGRFLNLEPDRHIELTWVTGARGTDGAETVVTVDLEPDGTGSLLRLRHEGFATAAACDQHAAAWPLVLEQMETRLDQRSQS